MLKRNQDINLFFFISFLPFIIIGLFLWANLGYNQSFIYLNSFHNKFGDFIIPPLTHIGDGITLGSLLTLIYWKKSHGFVLMLLFNLFLTSILVQLLKHVVFPDAHRPLMVFHPDNFHWIKGYEAIHTAFPSGHTMAITSILTTLAYYYRKNFWLQPLFVLIIVLVSYTRIYVGVHFLGDLVTSWLIGSILCSYLCKLYMVNWQEKFDKNSLYNQYDNLMLILASTSLIIGISIHFI